MGNATTLHRYVLNRLIPHLREMNRLGYREHLVAKDAIDQPRIRNKLAQFLVDEFVFFPRGVYFVYAFLFSFFDWYLLFHDCTRTVWLSLCRLPSII